MEDVSDKTVTNEAPGLDEHFTDEAQVAANIKAWICGLLIDYGFKMPDEEKINVIIHNTEMKVASAMVMIAQTKAIHFRFIQWIDQPYIGFAVSRFDAPYLL